MGDGEADGAGDFDGPGDGKMAGQSGRGGGLQVARVAVKPPLADVTAAGARGAKAPRLPVPSTCTLLEPTWKIKTKLVNRRT
jgi:hypothetical protein